MEWIILFAGLFVYFGLCNVADAIKRLAQTIKERDR